MPVVIVAGALANKPHNGGEAWVRMSWVRGLQRLGVDVYFLEQIAPATCVDAAGAPAPFADCTNRAYFRKTIQQFDLAGKAALIFGDGEQCEGIAWQDLLTLASSADLLINISGHLTLEPLLRPIRTKAYVDIDPGFTQIWHADPNTPFTIAPHDFYFTVGENIGAADCPIPTAGVNWRPTRQPVVLQDWPVSPANDTDRFTTIASWRGGFGPVQLDGQTYGLKVHEFRKVINLPRIVRDVGNDRGKFEIALDIHPGDSADRIALESNGWRLADPRAAAGDATAFRSYVQNSAAEFSVAQGVYVGTNSGWFSDRTTRYLASGKPVVVQDTGFGRTLSTGEGLLSFRTAAEAAQAVTRVLENYREHSEAARAIAEKYFDSERVLGRLLDEVGLG
jgi:hypothetical protein